MLNVNETPTRTHDFLLITSPRFFIRDLTHYPSFLESSGKGRPSQILNFILHLSADERDVIQHRRALRVSNLLESPGYSAVPYKYGDDVVKYAIAPCRLDSPPVMPEPQEPPPGASKDYLEEAMNATLLASEHTPVCFGFYVQRKEAADSIDDPTRAWAGGFERVARLTIPFGQHRGGPFDYHGNDAIAEQLVVRSVQRDARQSSPGEDEPHPQTVYSKLAASCAANCLSSSRGGKRTSTT